MGDGQDNMGDMEDDTDSEGDSQGDKIDRDKPDPIRVKLTVSLEEVYAAVVKRLNVRVKTPTSACVHRNLYVHLLGPEPEYCFCGQGDEDDLGRRGDVIVRLDVLDHPTHRMDAVVNRYDLHTTCRVSLMDYLYGRTYAIPHLDGTVLEATYPAQSGMRVAVVPGKGLLDPATKERATLYVFFEVSLPVVERCLLDARLNRLLLAKIFHEIKRDR